MGLLKDSVAKGIDYETYLNKIDQLLSEGKTSGPVQSEAMTEYTRLNQYRMKRIGKTVKINETLSQLAQSLDRKIYFLIIAEAWCGDAAHSVPVMAKLAELSENIEVKIVWRDENPELMDKYLTNGGKAIPKIVVLDAEDFSELAVWGPGPAPVRQMVMEHKKNPKEPYSEFVKQIQLWYSRDKSKTIQAEFAGWFEEILSPVGAKDI